MKCLLLIALPCLVVAFPPRLGDPFSPLGPWSRRGPPCGLPKFIDQLPEAAQEKVKAIWADYKDGDDCDTQHKQTKEIIMELPDEDRDKVFAGKCGPTFLRSVSSTIKKEFRAVWFDHRLSHEEKELALKKLAFSLLSGESLALFNKWEEELQVRKAELARKVAELSGPAKEAYESWKQIRLQEKTFLASLPKEVREELRTLCGYRGRRTESITEQPSTTTAEPDATEAPVDPSTTAQPLIEEKAKETEFAVFLDVSMPEELNTEAQCSYYI